MPFLNRPQPALILFLALFTSTAGNLVLTPILPDVARELGVSTATAGGLRIASGVGRGRGRAHGWGCRAAARAA